MKSRSPSPDARPSRHRDQDSKSSPMQKETLASRGRSGSHTHPSNDEGIFIIIIKYFTYICINIYSLVEHTSVSRGRQKERGTPVVNPRASTPLTPQHNQGIIIQLVFFLVLIYIRHFDG